MNELSKNELRAIAQKQRNLIFAVLVGFLYVIPHAYILILPYQLWAMYQLCSAIKTTYIWLWVVLTLIPLINMIPLLVINQSATNILCMHKIKVGFMGADTKSIH